VQEFIPAYKRGWVSALVTTMLPAGSLLAGFVGWQLLPIVGWRGLFLVGPGAAGAGVHDPLLGPGIAAVADWKGPDRGGAQVARVGFDVY
jgi:hypothetical protein